MKRFINKAIFTAAFGFLLVFGSIASAQERLFVQIEAHPTIEGALDMVPGYAARFDNVVGYRLVQTGWYVIALGPYPDRDSANAVRRDLQSRGVIPADAFVAPGNRFTARYWPEETPLAADPGTSEPELDPEVEALPEIEVDAGPEPVRQETLAEARRGEAQLTRDDRREIQMALQWKGFYDLAVDAAFGPGTRNAMVAWQEAGGHEPTGVLTTRQRAELISIYRSEIAALGLEPVRDEQAGIEITLPMGMVEFDRTEAPFVRYAERDGSGMQVLLISQEGSMDTLLGLYEIMQTLEIVPRDGFREQRRASFVLTGQDHGRRTHVYAQYADGQVKGFALLWEPAADALAERALAAMEESFAPFGDALQDGLGQQPSEVQRSDLLAGLEIRRPRLTQTGFYIDSTGRVLTSASLADQCSRLTIDERFEASIGLRDDSLGIIVLEPNETLAPMAFANFRTSDPRLHSEVILAGFPFEDLLSRPILTFGQLAALEGLNGEATLRRLTLEAMPGDIGGPVFDRSGTVLGMLVPPQQVEGRLLPDEVSFAAGAPAIHAALRDSGLSAVSMARNGTLPSEDLTTLAADITVLVSCWD